MKEFPFLKPLKKSKKIIGRGYEIGELLDTLYKLRMRNIVLTGPAGIGKTELIRGVASMYPDITFYELNLPSMVADTPYRGELEQKFDECFSRLSKQQNTILFIDEIHLIIDAGETQGKSSMTIGNMLKPYLSDGSITVWGATTTDEYKHILSDGALARRLPSLEIKPLTQSDNKNILIHCWGADNKTAEYISNLYPNNTELCIELYDRVQARSKRTGTPITEELIQCLNNQLTKN